MPPKKVTAMSKKPETELRAKQYALTQGDDKRIRKDVWKLVSKNIYNESQEGAVPTQTDRRLAFNIAQYINSIKTLLTQATDAVSSQSFERGAPVLAGLDKYTYTLMSKIASNWDGFINYLNFIDFNRMNQRDIQAVYSLLDSIIPLIDKYQTLIDRANQNGVAIASFKGLENFRNKIEIKDFTPLTDLVYSKQELLDNLFEPKNKFDSNLNQKSIAEWKRLMKQTGLSRNKTIPAMKKKYGKVMDEIDALQRKLQKGDIASYERTKIPYLIKQAQILQYSIQKGFSYDKFEDDDVEPLRRDIAESTEVPEYSDISSLPASQQTDYSVFPSQESFYGDDDIVTADLPEDEKHELEEYSTLMRYPTQSSSSTRPSMTLEEEKSIQPELKKAKDLTKSIQFQAKQKSNLMKVKRLYDEAYENWDNRRNTAGEAAEQMADAWEEAMIAAEDWFIDVVPSEAYRYIKEDRKTEGQGSFHLDYTNPLHAKFLAFENHKRMVRDLKGGSQSYLPFNNRKVNQM